VCSTWHEDADARYNFSAKLRRDGAIYSDILVLIIGLFPEILELLEACSYMSLVFEALQRLESVRSGLLRSPEPARLKEDEHLAVSKWEATLARAAEDGTGPSAASKQQEHPVGLPLQTGRSETSENGSVLGIGKATPLGRSAFAYTNSQQELLTSGAHAPSRGLVFIEGQLVELKTQHSGLHEHLTGQNVSIQRAEEKLHAVRHATERNTLEQKEMIEELKGVGTKVNVLAVVGLGLLTVSIVLDVLLFMHAPHITH
jgi:hypothetical protein